MARYAMSGNERELGEKESAIDPGESKPEIAPENPKVPRIPVPESSLSSNYNQNPPMSTIEPANVAAFLLSPNSIAVKYANGTMSAPKDAQKIRMTV